MKTDPKKQKVSVKATSKAKKYSAETKSGSRVDVTSKFVTDARASTGVFKPTSYKGKLLKNDQGKAYGVSFNDGTYMKASSGKNRSTKELKRKLAKDYAKYEAHETKRRTMGKRVSEAKPK